MIPSDVYDLVAQVLRSPDMDPQICWSFAKWLLDPCCRCRRIGPTLWRIQ